MPGTLLRNKPYTFIPVLPLQKDDRREILPHNKMDSERYTGRLLLELKVLSPLHIGSGHYRPAKNAEPVREFYRRGSVKVIPGSSLKGVVRSLAESASRSCLSLNLGGDCLRVQNSLPEGTGKVCTLRDACICCRIFGFVQKGEAFRGRLIFGEFTPTGEFNTGIERIPPMEQPFKNYPRERWVCGNERLYYCNFHQSINCGGPQKCPDCTKENWWEYKKKIMKQSPPAALRGRKFYLIGRPVKGDLPFEAVLPGSIFKGEVGFNSLDKDELSLLCFALGLDGETKLRMGYAKPAYFGTVEISLTGVVLFERSYMKSASQQVDPVALARSYGKGDSDVEKNVVLLRELSSGRRVGPSWEVTGY